MHADSCAKMCPTIELNRPVHEEEIRVSGLWKNGFSYPPEKASAGHVKLTKIGDMSTRNGDAAIEIIALTALKRVTSLRRRSKNIGRHTFSSLFNMSPILARIWPMQAIARSFTSWSTSCERNFCKVQS